MMQKKQVDSVDASINIENDRVVFSQTKNEEIPLLMDAAEFHNKKISYVHTNDGYKVTIK